jgi:hypothetical protein
MLRADGLLIRRRATGMTSACELTSTRARAPKILVFTDPAGDTARAMRALGISDVAPLDSAIQIEQALRTFVEAVATGAASLPDAEAARGASRSARANELLALLNSLP